MAFTPLGKRLSQLPLVLAGPILRQVTHDAVTVWVALKQSATVTLNVWNTDKPQQGAKPLMTQATATTPIGVNLHIVAVTARAIGALAEGNIYFYNLSFMVGDIAINLSQAVTPTTNPPTPLIQNPFAYGTYALPSFALPPADLSKLRLIHGSCRKPHAPGDDALPILDDLIAQVVQGADEAYRRPHQLILSGDQIYADDVSDALLLMLMDASNTLMGWQEVIPFNSVSAVPNSMEPYKRQDTLIAAGFTSDDLHSQLMSLGEYFAMYLFVWSDVLWPDPKTFDTYAEIFAISFPDLVGKPRKILIGNRGQKEDTYPLAAQAMANDAGKITQATANLANFSGTVSKVRKALANIPSYMICDDHEVTDDWNMTRGFCEGVYSATNKLGLRVLQNALVAYSVCQAWGNVPEQFEAGMSNTPGQQLLNILGSVTSSARPATPNDPPDSAKANSTYTQNANQLMTLVGLHPDNVLQGTTPYRVFHDPPKTPIMVGGVKVSDTSLRFNFSIEGGGHQVIVTDTRTWRAFPKSKAQAKDITHGDFLPSVVDTKLQPASVQDLQIGQDVPGSSVQDVPPLNGRQLLVVVTTNIPPIASIRAVERLFSGKGFVYENDLRDSWEFPSAVFDRMIVYLDKKVAKAGPPNAPVIFLSGDVHFAFSLRLSYWADKARLGDPQGQGTQSKRVFLQLVCSSLKNQDKNTLGLQDKGYNYHPHFFEAPFTPPHVQEIGRAHV